MPFIPKTAAQQALIKKGDEAINAINKLRQETQKAMQAQGAATRAHATANQQQTMGVLEKRGEENAKTHQGIKTLLDQGKASAEEVEMVKLMVENERKLNQERHLELIDLVSSQKAPNPNPSDGSGAGMKPTALFSDDSPFEVDANGKVVGVGTALPKDEDVAAELARLKLENVKLKKENNDLLTPDDHQTLKERAQKAKHVDPTAVGRTAASVKKHIKEAKSARKGKKQAEHVRREGLRSRTRSQTNSRA